MSTPDGQTVRQNPWACFWCIYACWTIILVAFETQASCAVVGIPQFRKDFGFEFPEGSGEYVLPAGWQSAFSGAPSASCCVPRHKTNCGLDWTSIHAFDCAGNCFRRNCD
ncbi:hypothetical protein HBH49_083170 [Parastagonospora nodorum]|nr:hypothetical protein HBH49_083170 [Parastagonospora nodorum]KAH5442337.1 hypothetical protein HBI47_029280 [Parastagonospora nodorum]